MVTAATAAMTDARPRRAWWETAWRPRNPKNRDAVKVALVLLGLATAPAVVAGVGTDGTVGPLRALSGQMVIGEDLGRRVGDNLFHSFWYFDIATGESATFTGTTDIANVIGRVTGGWPTHIDGLLRSQVGQANFFLVNPAGVLFGPNARVDVPGAFHVSTADRIDFADGYYSATDIAGSRLSMAAPESFGFLARQPPAEIKVAGSPLEFKPGKTASLVGGNVELTGARLTSPGGDIRVVGVGSPDCENRVAIGDAASTLRPNGQVQLTGGSSIDVSGTDGPESILLRGGSVAMSQYSTLFASHRGDSDSVGVVRVDADDLSLVDSVVRTEAVATGHSSAIDLRAQHELRLERSAVLAATLNSPRPSTIRLQAADLDLRDSAISSAVFGSGAGPDIEVTADQLRIDAAAAIPGAWGITSGVVTGATGKGGHMHIDARDIALTNGGRLASNVAAGAAGTGGDLDLRVGERLTAAGWSQVGLSGLWTTTDSQVAGSHGGDITITAPDATISLADAGGIQTGTAGLGHGGTVQITAGQIDLRSGGQIGTNVVDGATGPGGDLEINVQEGLTATGWTRIGDADLFSGLLTSHTGTGTAGALSIEVGGAMRLADGGLIETSTAGPGQGGTVSIAARQIDLRDGGRINSLVHNAAGSGGNLTIDVGEDLTATGSTRIGDTTYFSALNTWTTGAGAAGALSIAVGGSMSLTDGARVGSLPIGGGTTGPTDIQVGQELILDRAQINASASGSGVGGGLRIEAGGAIRLRESIIAMDNQGSGPKAAPLVLTAPDVAIIDSDARSIVFGSGPGADIEVRADHLIVDARTVWNGQSNIETAVEAHATGAAGDLRIDAARIDLRNGGRLLSIVNEGGLGPGGDVEVYVSDSLKVGGRSSTGNVSGIGTTAFSDDLSADGGDLLIHAPNALVSLTDGAFLFAGTVGAGDSGDLSVNARRFSASGNAFVHAPTSGAGAGGDVTIRLAEDLELRDRANIQAWSDGAGTAGSLVLGIGGNLTMDRGRLNTAAYAGGDGGDMAIRVAGSAQINQSPIEAFARDAGDGGNIALDVGRDLSLTNGAHVNTSTYGTGAGGEVWLHIGGALLLSGQSTISALSLGQGPGGAIRFVGESLRASGGAAIQTDAFSSGAAGLIDLNVMGLLALDDARISATTSGAGAGGAIRIAAGSLNATNDARIASSTSASGNAGTLDLQVGGRLGLSGGSQLATSTNGAGDAGRLSVRAGTMLMDQASVTSRAEPGASGLAGQVALAAGTLDLRHGATISTASDQQVPTRRIQGAASGRITIDAGALRLSDRSEITAGSTGNVPAGAIVVDATDMDLSGLSRISTESRNADGGPIDITSGSLWLTDSQITTSVLGSSGSGGDIRIETGLLGLNGGFIQANTAAVGASGGYIFISAGQDRLRHGFVQIGGNERLTFRPGLGLNVIQAAAPFGVQGNIATNLPPLDVTKDITALATPVGDPVALVQDRCMVGRPFAGSSLVERPMAGIPVAPAAPATVSFAGERLDRLLGAGG